MQLIYFLEGTILYLLGWGYVSNTQRAKILQIAEFAVEDLVSCQSVVKKKLIKSELCVVSEGHSPSKSCSVSLFFSKYLCWAKLNLRKLLSPPPQICKRLQLLSAPACPHNSRAHAWKNAHFNHCTSEESKQREQTKWENIVSEIIFTFFAILWLFLQLILKLIS
jgi:hypothetical protein